MLTLPLSAPSPLIPWLVHLATWLARSLNMPQPIVHDTGMFVFAQVLCGRDESWQGAVPVPAGRELQSLSANHPNPKENRHDPPSRS